MSEFLCGYCFKEYAPSCCEKSEYENVKRQLAKREDDYRKLRKRSDEQIERLKDELESYKCDNQVLIEIISDCLNKWNKYEAFEVLTQVVEHYDQLKEKGE